MCTSISLGNNKYDVSDTFVKKFQEKAKSGKILDNAEIKELNDIASSDGEKSFITNIKDQNNTSIKAIISHNSSPNEFNFNKESDKNISLSFDNERAVKKILNNLEPGKALGIKIPPGNIVCEVKREADKSFTITAEKTTISVSGDSLPMSVKNKELINNILKSGFNGDVRIEKNKDNAGREVAIFMPKSDKKPENPEVTFFFHGLRGSINMSAFGGGEAGESGLMPEIQKHIDNGKVFVLSETDDDSGPNKIFGSSDTKANFKNFRASIESKIKEKYGILPKDEHFPTNYAGHSAGGQAMYNVISSDENNMKNVKKIVDMDGSYGSLPDILKKIENYNKKVDDTQKIKVDYFNQTNGDKSFNEKTNEWVSSGEDVKETKENKSFYTRFERSATNKGHYGANRKAIETLSK